MTEVVLAVLAVVVVLGIQAGLVWNYMQHVTRYQRANRDLETCQEIWALTPDY